MGQKTEWRSMEADTKHMWAKVAKSQETTTKKKEEGRRRTRGTEIDPAQKTRALGALSLALKVK